MLYVDSWNQQTNLTMNELLTHLFTLERFTSPVRHEEEGEDHESCCGLYVELLMTNLLSISFVHLIIQIFTYLHTFIFTHLFNWSSRLLVFFFYIVIRWDRKGYSSHLKWMCMVYKRCEERWCCTESSSGIRTPLLIQLHKEKLKSYLKILKSTNISEYVKILYFVSRDTREMGKRGSPSGKFW